MYHPQITLRMSHSRQASLPYARKGFTILAIQSDVLLCPSFLIYLFASFVPFLSSPAIKFMALLA